MEYEMLFTAMIVIALMMFLAYQGVKRGILRIHNLFTRPVSTPAIPPHEGTTVEGEQSEIFSTANRKSRVSLALAELPDPSPPSPEIDEAAASCAVVVRDPASLLEFPRSLDWGRFERPTVIRKGLAIDDAPRW